MTEKIQKSNRLINEKSPYLLQHAHNPVDWYSWSEEAFEKAKKEDKPIFLSIGYSTCYWCHVMEREIFENEDIAKEMNRIFVNIKVDREERPDVDRVYMTALQSMTGSGGWPMSMFLTNDLKPFYGATYVPPESKFGLPGFEDLIHQLEKAWKTRRDEINESGESIINLIKEASATEKYAGELTADFLLKGCDQFKNTFDEEYGGFGSSPKFPRPPGLNFLLRMYHRFDDGDSLKMLVRTLLQMARGGMYDHIGGGFHRYSVDRFWRVPHFEKMLYDQAQLVTVYLEAFQITGDVHFAEIAKEVLHYVSQKLTDKNGGFYSAEDAESALDAKEPHEKEEGAFYVLEKKELEVMLGSDAKIFNYYYGVWDEGNAPAGSDPHSVFTNKNILYAAHTLSETSNKFEKSTDEVAGILEEGRKKLFKQREKRPRPHLDDKILTSWNGLMISAYSKAYQVTVERAYLESAKSSANFILKNLFNDSTQTLLHRYRDYDAKFDGNLEDYAFFTNALIDLYESCFEDKYLDYAIKLMETAMRDFYDDGAGGFYDTTGKDKSILVRTKEDYDSAEPTGNSITILNLLRLSYIIDKSEWFDKAKDSLDAFADKIAKMPYAMPQMLVALDYFLHKPKQIVIAGKEEDITTREMLQEVFKRFLPGKVLIQYDGDKPGGKTFASKVISKTDRTTAYVCENFACKLPVTSVEELGKLLNS